MRDAWKHWLSQSNIKHHDAPPRKCFADEACKLSPFDAQANVIGDAGAAGDKFEVDLKPELEETRVAVEEASREVQNLGEQTSI